MWTDLRLWLRRRWAAVVVRWRGYAVPALHRRNMDMTKRYRQRREIGNVLLHLGKRSGRFHPTH